MVEWSKNGGLFTILNYIPSEFEELKIKLSLIGLRWDSVRKSTSPFIAFVVSLLGVEPKKPRAFLWIMLLGWLTWHGLIYIFSRLITRMGTSMCLHMRTQGSFLGVFFWAEF